MTATARRRQLQAARNAKNDEFYTLYDDVDAELRHYTDALAGKAIYLNCDDPRTSNFFRWFVTHFHRLGLRSVTATAYVPGGNGVRATYAGAVIDLDNPGTFGVEELVGDGDFRSAECRELLAEADVVVTNPPFSLFREHLAQLVEHDKNFIVVGTANVVSYRDFVSLIVDGGVWAGRTFNRKREFALPDSYPKFTRIDETGRKIGLVPSICWYTNLDHGGRGSGVELTATYDPDRYPRYDTFDAIEVARVADIPADYTDVMGVPVTFLGRWNPDQFEILGQLGSNKVSGTNFGAPRIDGKCRYARLLIRRRDLVGTGTGPRPVAS